MIPTNISLISESEDVRVRTCCAMNTTAQRISSELRRQVCTGEIADKMSPTDRYTETQSIWYKHICAGVIRIFGETHSNEKHIGFTADYCCPL